MFMQDATRFVADPALPVAAPVRSGLLASTLVETETGWHPAGSLRRGELVHTFDGGLRPLVTLDRDWLEPGAALIRLEGGVLGNADDQMLLPAQHLLIDTWEEATLPEALIALIPAEALSGLRGAIRTVAGQPLEIVTPLFRADEVIYANGGLLMHCPGIAAGPRGEPDGDYFARLDISCARQVMRSRLGSEPATADTPAPAKRRFWRMR